MESPKQRFGFQNKHNQPEILPNATTDNSRIFIHDLLSVIVTITVPAGRSIGFCIVSPFDQR
jgi:hypothetical protein